MCIAMIMMLFTAQAVFAAESDAKETSYADGETYVVNGLYEPVPAYNSELSMTDKEVYNLYENFLEKEGYDAKKIVLTEEVLNEFTDYAVEQGIISDTAVQRAAVQKAVVRANLRIAADDAEAIGWTTASACLKHSLQDNPVDVYIESTDPISTQVKNSSPCKQIISDFKSYVKGKKLSSRTTSGSTILNSSTDLTLAFNRVSYVATGTKNSSTGVWTLKITFKDTYDFDNGKWTSAGGLKAATINALNAYGVHAQSVGAVVPYDIQIQVKTTFSE